MLTKQQITTIKQEIVTGLIIYIIGLAMPQHTELLALGLELVQVVQPVQVSELYLELQLVVSQVLLLVQVKEYSQKIISLVTIMTKHVNRDMLRCNSSMMLSMVLARLVNLNHNNSNNYLITLIMIIPYNIDRN